VTARLLYPEIGFTRDDLLEAYDLWIVSNQETRRSISPGGATQISVAPDGSPVFTRDLSTEEIYALTVKRP
jgi:hypothetical protein